MSQPVIKVQVHVDMAGTATRVGTAFFHWRGGNLSTTFSYEQSWLADKKAYGLGPDLPLVAGTHHVAGLPGPFSDCAPDRWGRNLISRRIRAEARLSNTSAASLSEVDYLIGVSDSTRLGALRFRVDDSAPFLATNNEVPRLIALPKLLSAATRVADARRTNDEYEAVKLLLDAGTGSLGGARPKAAVQRDDGRLLIAKFPHPHDEWNIAAWEKTALDLARVAGIVTPEHTLVRIDSASVLLLDRFDRGDDQTRIPYISAMTMMSEHDGAHADYVDLAGQLEESGAGDTRELQRLFQRVVFGIAIHNTDDHLRNTGFLHSRDGWRLSPLFDVNPNPDLSARRQTTIAGADNIDDGANALLDLAPVCRLDAPGAQALISEVIAATAQWRQVAATNGLSRSAIDDFSDTFETTTRALGRVIK